MTEQELQRMADNVARSTTCQICGNSKQRAHAFCMNHWWALPLELRSYCQNMWNGWTSSRSRAWIRCYYWLKRAENEQATMPDTEVL
ncbi:MAG: hypothetical protein LAN64_01925 [Acidobacteriia bacterium]|nr:hypothetical protein [Terriglobia bacterium]